VQDYTIDQFTNLSAAEAAQKIDQLKFRGTQQTIAADLIPEIRQRLRFMEDVGLGYLALGRSAKTLSGGESQRIRLAAQLGSNLRGVLYVLDEPTIGLHPRDNLRLLETLTALREKGNSLVIVEHDEETMRDRHAKRYRARDKFRDRALFKVFTPPSDPEIAEVLAKG